MHAPPRPSANEDDSLVIAPPTRVEFNALLLKIARLEDAIKALTLWVKRQDRKERAP
jgi:hypothetical protein